MKLSDLPHLSRALALMGLDGGADIIPDAEIPADWQNRCRAADDEISILSEQQIGDLAHGESSDQRTVASRARNADAVLNAAFDGGPLDAIVFRPWSSIHDARDAEARALKAGRAS